MQNLGQLGDWAVLDAGEHILIPPKPSHKVTIKVNAPRKTALYYHPLRLDGSYDKERTPGFLALVEGLDEIQFRVPFGIAVIAEAEIAVMTMADMVIQPEEAGESFAAIVERRAVSADVAAVLARANANQRSMMRQMNDIIANQQRIVAEQLRASKPTKEVKPDGDTSGKSATGDAGKTGKSQQVPDGGASVVKPAAAGEGNGSGS